jgi:sec-independent protein translocase protein TatC
MSQKDLFDDSTMTFGEHLEVLRVHLWKAIVGLVIGTVIAFTFSRHIIVAVQTPVIDALDKYFAKSGSTAEEKGQYERMKAWAVDTFMKSAEELKAEEAAAAEKEVDPRMMIELDARAVAAKLHEMDPNAYPPPPEEGAPQKVTISLAHTPLADLLNSMRKESLHPRTDGVDEAFMIYLKVSVIVGIVISSPWIFFQLWLFVGAGLYSHERKYVYTYLPMSVLLFLGGAAFCFFGVIPFVLKFLFEFNDWLHLRPEIKISTWITFALMVSLMFGVSFQLPLVMLFLERISLVSSKLYREKRRHAILIIAFLSMVLTPSDPVSMMMMMVPLCVLYEFGIILCGRKPATQGSPFEALPA